jgi:CHASE3 domain sensor protein
MKINIKKILKRIIIYFIVLYLVMLTMGIIQDIDLQKFDTQYEEIEEIN